MRLWRRERIRDPIPAMDWDVRKVLLDEPQDLDHRLGPAVRSLPESEGEEPGRGTGFPTFLSASSTAGAVHRASARFASPV